MEDLPEPEVETVEVNPVLVLAECTFVVLQALVPLSRIQIQQGDLQDMQLVNQLQQGMDQLGRLLLALDSKMVKPVENAPPPSSGHSGLILPR